MRRTLLLAVLLGALAWSAPARAGSSCTLSPPPSAQIAGETIAVGLTYREVKVACPPFGSHTDMNTAAHVVEVDLKAEGVSIHASSSVEETGCIGTGKHKGKGECFVAALPSTVVAGGVAAPGAPVPQIAVNANLFVNCCSADGSNILTALRGLEMERGHINSAVRNNPEDTSPPSHATYATSLLVSPSGTASILTLDAGVALPRITTAVTGSHHIVAKGKNMFPPCGSILCNSWLGPNARTAVGLKDATTLLIVVVDGKDGGDAGVTLFQIGDIMRQLGAREAINLDGGGSSAMAQRGGPTGYTMLSKLADVPNPSGICTVPAGATTDCERYVGTVLTVVAPPISTH